MAIQKRPASPRQKMINLMYVVLMAMLALNVSTDVLKGFTLVGNSLDRTIHTTEQENKDLLDDLATQYRKNPAKVKPWWDKAQTVQHSADSLCRYIDELKWAIARETDGADGNPNNIQHKDDLEAAGVVMLNPATLRGRVLYRRVNHFRDFVTSFITDRRRRAIVAANLSTDVPKGEDNIGKNWQEYMFESMPSIAAVTMLSKLQSDIRKAEGEVLHTLAANIGVKDIRVNELNAYVLPEATTLFPGDEFRSQIFMAAIDTTQRPEIYVNGRRLNADGHYNFRVGAPGSYDFRGYITMPNAAGEVIRREFSQHYTVIAPPTGATVAADLMNVLYAGYDNPISVSASGISSDKIHLSMSGGTLSAKGNGKYVARPAHVGQEVSFTVTGEVGGKSQTMGAFTFKVRKLPDPAAFISIGGDQFRGGRIAKGSIVGATRLDAAIDDGLLNIPFSVRSFECVFFDRLGNVLPRPSAGASFTEAQRDLIRQLSRGKRFYISNIHAVGPDGIERTLSGSLEVIIN